ncbi:MAG: adenylosuccinate synthase [Candidatus Thermoplasmatota archaeon]|nr:adenylosuccinate synthase [Candidatus Thermoplasmatota archaeon]
MRSLVLGLQFGDEGKGKITDFISGKDSVLVRYNGGTNAGHTVVTGKGTFKFHLLPAGSLRSKTIVLGNGMVIDPEALISEIKTILPENPELRILVSSAANVVTKLHKAIDKSQEEMRGASKIGTTSHGIGPTYEEKYSRNGIRIEDLKDVNIVRKKLSLISKMRESELRGTEYQSEEKLDELANELASSWPSIKNFVTRTESFLFESVRSGEEMVFEGGHGTLLDIDFGSYPYVTSSNTVSGAIHTGSGVSLRKINRIIGVIKSYTSRVGEGPFPTELKGQEADKLREAGSEYGTTTGRPRRVGWLDIPLIKYASELNDVDELSITKLDVLGAFKEISICKSYDHSITNPMNVLLGFEKTVPEYITMDSWGILKESEIQHIVETGYKSVPQEMKDYIGTIEKMCNKPVKIISIGKIRESTIIKP